MVFSFFVSLTLALSTLLYSCLFSLIWVSKGIVEFVSCLRKLANKFQMQHNTAQYSMYCNLDTVLNVNVNMYCTLDLARVFRPRVVSLEPNFRSDRT